MALAIVYSRASSGMSAPLVTVEVHLSGGIPKFQIGGLAEKAVKESRDRVRSALINAHFEFPARIITVNLAPADLPKEGSRFDLPIALGILAASHQIPYADLSKYEFTGELALSGELRPVRGVLSVVLSAHNNIRTLVVPYANSEEAALAKDVHVLMAKHLLEVCAHLKGIAPLQACTRTHPHVPKPKHDMADVKGQGHAKRALEIAAAGGHSLLMLGPPGTGKTMLASRLPSILPPLDENQALDIAAINSLTLSGFDPKKWQELPFRAPHHTISSVALVGGGRPPKPGEVSLAHHGVLFLDEFPEYSRQVLECLREPIESGHVAISRAAYQMTFPARFQLIAAMNPCPCGYAGSKIQCCDCSQDQIKRYRAKISGPLLDRIDMHVEVARIPAEVLTDTTIKSESSALIRERVIKTREFQFKRQRKVNTNLSTTELVRYCVLQADAQAIVQQAISRFSLSARGYARIIKLARTIADLAAQETINVEHIAEALNYRCMDKLSV